MNLFVSGIKAPLGCTEEDVFKKAIKTAKISSANIKDIFIHKKSVDARKGNINLVYSVCINLINKESFNNIPSVVLKEEFDYKLQPGNALLSERPVIIGAGPAGLFCCHLLCEYGFRPIVIERGSKTEKRVADVENFFKNRILDTESNVQFGEGGAGTFSDGKLVTRINDPRCDYVLDLFVKHGAYEEIKHLAKPHIGTDNLRKIIISLREGLISKGADFIFNTAVEDIDVSGGKVRGVKLSNGEYITADAVVLACGHSARDTYKMLLKRGIGMEKKPFSVGFRIEHKRRFIDEGRYGKYASHPDLGAAEYQFSLRKGNRGCYTFCMCPGGSVVAASSEENGVVTNGMSDYSRNADNSNSAIAASVLPEDTGADVLSGIEFQRKLERAAYIAGGSTYAAPVQLSKDFIKGEKTFCLSSVKPSYPCGYEFADFNNILPPFAAEILKEGLLDFEKKLRGFSLGDGVLSGVETRTSAPIRILRGKDYSAIGAEGLYPAGEGAGYAGGITSAAVDGLKVAEYLIKKYKSI